MTQPTSIAAGSVIDIVTRINPKLVDPVLNSIRDIAESRPGCSVVVLIDTVKSEIHVYDIAAFAKDTQYDESCRTTIVGAVQSTGARTVLIVRTGDQDLVRFYGPTKPASAGGAGN